MTKRRAKGILNPDGKSRSIAIHFETGVFDEIADEAVANGRSFGEQVRIYIGRGMDAEKKLITRRADPAGAAL